MVCMKDLSDNIGNRLDSVGVVENVKDAADYMKCISSNTRLLYGLESACE